MEDDIIDYLKDIGYTGPCGNKPDLEKSLVNGLKDSKLRHLIVWLCKELKVALNLDENVENISNDEELSNFQMELSSFIKELGCPYRDLLDGPVTERFSSKDKLALLLLFLTSELMAARIISIDRPDKVMELRLHESETAKQLKQILIALNFPRPPDNIAAADLFAKVDGRIKTVLNNAPPDLLGKSLLKGKLSKDQWSTLTQVQDELKEEYKLRREMLLKRLDVTIQSFEWSDRAKGKEDTIAKAFVEKRRNLISEPSVSLADVLSAREDAAIIEKTSGALARKNTQSSLHKVIIGRVPDRGGRPSEQEAPPPEMPSWQKERAQGGGGGGAGNFSRGGGRVQGGWNQREGGGRGRDSGDRGDYRGNQGGDGRGRQRDYRDDNRGHRGGGGGRGRHY